MLRYKFPKTEKLKKNWEFLRVYKEGKKYKGDYILIYILQKQPSCKIGISTPKRIIGKAVTRNRAKRLIRETYRLNKHLLRNNINLVVVATQKIIGIGYKDLEKDFLNLLTKAGSI